MIEEGRAPETRFRAAPRWGYRVWRILGHATGFFQRSKDPDLLAMPEVAPVASTYFSPRTSYSEADSLV